MSISVLFLVFPPQCQPPLYLHRTPSYSYACRYLRCSALLSYIFRQLVPSLGSSLSPRKHPQSIQLRTFMQHRHHWPDRQFMYKIIIHRPLISKAQRFSQEWSQVRLGVAVVSACSGSICSVFRVLHWCLLFMWVSPCVVKAQALQIFHMYTPSQFAEASLQR
jgi:hypothetical protein